jgi:3-phosphoshikimate 1-carboxyvinyltransferase
LMKHFGATVTVEKNEVFVPAGGYTPTPYRVEPDWSAASYWYAFTALSDDTEILLPGVDRQSKQGDIAIVDFMKALGVASRFDEQGLTLTRTRAQREVAWNFIDCPDLAQTVLPVCAVLGIPGTFTGLESLIIKETDRISALRKELGKLGARLPESMPGEWKLEPATTPLPAQMEFDTYHDHRMAMGLAPLATRMDVTIRDPRVVDKSYPAFWEDVKSVGFDTNLT